MERGDARQTRRPLLEGAEEEVETPLPSLPAGGAAPGLGRGSRRKPEDRYARLQAGPVADDDAEEGAGGASDTEGLIAGRAQDGGAAVSGSPASSGGAAAQFYENEDCSLDVADEAEACAPQIAAAAAVAAAAASAAATAVEAPLPTPLPTAVASRPPPAADSCADEIPVSRVTMRPQDEVAEETTSRGAVVIEMQNLVSQPEGSEDDVDSEPCAQAPRGRGDERHCFICLQEGDKDGELVRCCTTCYACTHVRCWRDWRNNQRITALRSRLLGLRPPTQNLLRCTICKSGTAVLAGEEDGLEWMNDLLCGHDAGNAGDDGGGPGRLFGGALAQRDDSDEDGDTQLEDLVDMRTCVALMVYLGVLVVVLLVACLLIVMQQFYAGDVVLCCIIVLYELSVLQIVALAVARRRSSMVQAAQTEGGADGNDVEAQRSARELPLVQAP